MINSRAIMLIGIFALIHGVHSIIRGKLTTMTDKQFMVSIWVNDEFKCAGGMITVMHILTSADCVYMEPLDRMLVRAGRTSADRGPNLGRVQNIIVHSDYELSVEAIEEHGIIMQNNIAVIQLAQPTRRFIGRFAVLPISSGVPAIGDTCELFGWGRYSLHAETIPAKLRGAYVTVVDVQYIPTVRSLLQPNEFCAMNATSRTKLGQGDGGGMLICNGVAAGIIIRNVRHSVPSLFVFLGTYAYKQWIEDACQHPPILARIDNS